MSDGFLAWTQGRDQEHIYIPYLEVLCGRRALNKRPTALKDVPAVHKVLNPQP